jgi:hypothetical protein
MTLPFLLWMAAAEPALNPEAKLAEVRRVYVDRLTGDQTAAQMRDLLIAALQNSRLFQITENEEKADMYLRGAAEDLVYTDNFSASEGVSGRVSLGRGRASGNRARDSDFGSAGLSEHESIRTQDRRHEAMCTVRLVTRDGDVIWSTTQESSGGKFRGASADVADKVTKQLAADLDRARRARAKP